jgi:hypothetical protein
MKKQERTLEEFLADSFGDMSEEMLQAAEKEYEKVKAWTPFINEEWKICPVCGFYAPERFVPCCEEEKEEKKDGDL